jgi:hypothetical protein
MIRINKDNYGYTPDINYGYIPDEMVPEDVSEFDALTDKYQQDGHRHGDPPE